ncbi:MAG: AraC family transcriptional regulator [Alistipes sp.]
MSYQNYTIENKETTHTELCSADCSSCRVFPSPYRRISESPYCRFTQHTLIEGERMPFVGDRLVRVLFIESGSFQIEDGVGNVREVTPHQCVCLSRGLGYVVTARAESRMVMLALLQRLEFCEQDIYDREKPHDSVVKMDSMPVLTTHPALERIFSNLFDIQELRDCVRYQRLKTSELFMMVKVLYTPFEHAYFFQSMIQPQDNFCVFVCNNYDKTDSVAGLAELAGMSISVFKRRFAEHFNDSVYHWMMRQKALRVFSDIRDGEDNTKVLMAKYDFKYYTQFSRFCKNYLQATPAQLIASIKEG